MSAIEEYGVIVTGFKKYLKEYTDLQAEFVLDKYPMEVHLYVSDEQLSMFEEKPPVVNEDGEMGSIIIRVSGTSTIQNTLQNKIDTKVLKKIISYAEKVCVAYLRALKELVEEKRRENRFSGYMEEIIKELSVRASEG